ncbi:MAG TPA: trimeric intracellular cation channel family protein [Bacteroidaceae bacterium]|nr:trimeric intracellular cation channel family protein [Bacteroidaceae bacterium]HQL26228.1 trimeric intracellular cation channel family protein [Bacteroidaceae bacterium]
MFEIIFGISFIDYIRENYVILLDHGGTFAFALSGIRLAAEKEFDWFGALVVGFVTAIGGGTTRDLLLGVTPFWMLNGSYLIVTALALLSFIFLKNVILRLNKTIFLFDTIGLGLFVVVGIEKTLAADYPFWVAIIMGMITGSVGGLIRDVLINEVPLILRRDIYAVACIIGGLVFALCIWLEVDRALTNIISALTVMLVRFTSVRFKIQLPKVKHHEADE